MAFLDETGITRFTNKIKTFIDNKLNGALFEDESSTASEAEPRDADTLGGRYTAEDISNMLKWTNCDTNLDMSKNEVLVCFDAHNIKDYGTSTYVIPIDSIKDGNFKDNIGHVVNSTDGYYTKFVFNITTSGKFNMVSMTSNNQYFSPNYSLYIR